jgi:hypothetical protein
MKPRFIALLIGTLLTGALGYAQEPETVYVASETAPIYHRAGCVILSRATAISLTAATQRGLQPCSVCQPLKKQPKPATPDEIKKLISSLRTATEQLQVRLVELATLVDTMSPQPESVKESRAAVTQQEVPRAPEVSRPPVEVERAVPATRTRCQATTKKGTQCSRSASAGSSYCWQHQGR